MKIKELRFRVTCEECKKDNWVLALDSGGKVEGCKTCTYCKGRINYSFTAEQEKKPVKPRRLCG
jgi:hypothetical protein